MADEKVQELMQGVREGRLSRREFIKRAAALGFSASTVGALLAACGGDVPATAGAVATNPAGGATAVATQGSGIVATAQAAATNPAGAATAVATQEAGGAQGTATRATGGTPTRATAPGTPGTPVAGGAGGTIKFYSSFPRTGANKSQTDSVVNAIRLALEDVNYRAGNFTIVYGQTEDLDDGIPSKNGNWDGPTEANNMQRAIADPDCMVYIGTFNSGAAAVSIPIANRANLAMISPANTYVGLTKKIEGAVEPNEPEVYYPTGTRNYCRTIASDDIQAAVGVAYARELGAQRVFVLDDSELYGRGLASVFAQVAGRSGLQVVSAGGRSESIEPQASDYRSLAQRIRSANADMVYFGGITGNNAGKLWQDLRSVLGQNFRLMGPDGIYDSDFLAAAGQAAEGTYLSFGGLPPSQLQGRGAEFVRRYRAKYNGDPETYASYGYEAAAVAINAVQRAGRKDRAAIRDALLQTRDWDQGVLGRWSFTETGDTTLTSMTVNQVRNGQFEFIKIVEAPR